MPRSASNSRARLQTGAPSLVPAEQSLQVMAILDGIYRSQEAGREVKIKV